MSKIALEGNASGTGTFTIASPNSNSNYTLTLPSSTGTVVVTGGAQTIEFAAGTAAAPSITFTGDTNTGIFSPGADTIAFAEGGAEAMRIDSSGNVGIGVSPNKRLTVYSDDGYIQMLNASTGTGNTDGSFIGVEGGTTALRIVNQENDAISFSTNGLANERARITSGGALCIGTTTAVTGSVLTVNGKAAFVSNLVLEDGGSVGWSGNPAVRNTAGSGYLILMNGTTGGVGLLNGGTSWTSLSDERYKDIIEPISDAAQKVSTLRAVIGKYKTDEEGTRRSFLIAQDVQAVLPEAVDTTNLEKLGLQYTEIIPLLVAAIKEQTTRIEALEAEVAALKGQ